jgi:hypothetical protein
MRNIVLVIALVNSLASGCATARRSPYAELDARVKSWIGKTEDDLVVVLGMPTKVHETPGGTRVLEFYASNERTSAVTGYGGTEVTSYDKYCKTTYIVGASKKIESASWEGNNCPKNSTSNGPTAFDKLMGW